MAKINPKVLITRQELLNGNNIGIYRVADEPIIGYKTVFCSLKSDKTPYWTCCVLEVEIPIGAVIVSAVDDANYIKEKHRVVSLRTDKLFIKSIEEIDLKNKLIKKQLSLDDYVCRSYWFDNFYYSKEEMHPKRQLSLVLSSSYESGLHFFLQKEKAEKYPIS